MSPNEPPESPEAAAERMVTSHLFKLDLASPQRIQVVIAGMPCMRLEATRDNMLRIGGLRLGILAVIRERDAAWRTAGKE